MVIAAVFIIEVIAGVLAFILMDHIQETLTTYLNAAMVHYQDNHDLRAAIDYIQGKVFVIMYLNNKDSKDERSVQKLSSPL